MRRFLAPLLAVLFAVSCQTPAPPTGQPERDQQAIVEEAFSAYMAKGADGTDINAMLSYLSLSMFTNRIESWQGVRDIAAVYVHSSETQWISPNYPLRAGTNEASIVSNFYFGAIGLVEASSPLSQAPGKLSDLSQTLLTKIHSQEYTKDGGEK